MSHKKLIAGPGTGKTYKVKEIVKEYPDLSKVLVISFTNATISDLLESFAKDSIPINKSNCATLHSYAFRLNSQKDLHILDNRELSILQRCSRRSKTDFLLLCRLLKCISFDQMIENTISYIEINPIHAKTILGAIDLLIVDEFQDFNPLEQKLIKVIANIVNNVLILGDDDQCIYGFKKATIDGLLGIYNDVEIENINHENLCRRCPDAVVKCARNLIINNKTRINKEWKASGKEGSVEFTQIQSQKETSDYIIRCLEDIKKTDPEGSIMILSSVRFAVDNLVRDLGERGYDISNFWVEKINIELQKKLWWLRFLCGSKKTVNLLLIICEKLDVNSPVTKKFYKYFGQLVNQDINIDQLIDYSIQNNLIDKEMLELYNQEYDLISENPYFCNLPKKPSPDYKLEKFLEEINISEPVEFKSHGINLMSIHKSKGLQAEYVFILGLVEGILPNTVNGILEIEGYRRLLFVALTRAKEKLFLISTVEWDKSIYKVDKTKFRYDKYKNCWIGNTSNFIAEMMINS